MRQGMRASLLPAINLAQVSEFSLVLMQIGVQSGHTAPGVAGAVTTAFVVLAVANTFVMMRSDAVTRLAIPVLKRIGLRDLDRGDVATDESPAMRKRRILVLGFYRIASSFVAELERRQSSLCERVVVVDFNPQVFSALRERGVKVHYNDISNADSLLHAGVGDAEIVISSVPDSLLKGTTNEKLVRHVRSINPTAKIIATADVLADAQNLYDAGADYVTVARLDQASELIDVIAAAEGGRLSEMKNKLGAQMLNRREILP
jgi:voltage-gated potassium channel Kch